MKKTTLSLTLIGIIIFQVGFSQNYPNMENPDNVKTENEKNRFFSIGYAFTATHYSTSDRDFIRPFYSGILSQGSEFQTGFHWAKRWSVISGVALNVVAINSIPYEHGVNEAVNRHNVYINQISVPLLIMLKVYDNSKKCYHQTIIGVYWGTILNDFYINQLFDSGQGWYDSGSYTNNNQKNNFYDLYAGYNFNYKITNQFHLFVEPFLSYQLKNKQIITNVYDRFMFGFKAGLTFNFKNK